MIERPMYVEKIMAYADTPFVKILSGVRRCGKSTILKMIIQKLKEEKEVPEEQIASSCVMTHEENELAKQQKAKARFV